MRSKKPIKFRAVFVLPSWCKAIYGPKPFRIGKHRYEYDKDPKGSADTYPNYLWKGKRLSSLGGKGHFLAEMVTAPKDRRKYRTTDRFFKVRDVELAVEWFKKEIEKEAVRIVKKGSYVRVEGIIRLVEKAFGDV